ncbi:TPA: YdgA family protein [Haemophilus influenzae]|uniref:YdgA family protein n=2 Tax=Haemophilus influenzae TaxID=727 RepID=UPI000D00C074|nr:DUF945 family protein [Haemophilus influenzae]MCK9643495.1 DUF945 family protein [Haemophilus influenzae]PRI51872.1 hypothetical protein BVZ76_00309 [Haemophilus influenzae]
MKKSKIAAGVVVALAAVWCTSAWFTGKKAEEEYLHQLKQLNQLFAKTEALEESKIFYKNIKYDRGLFASHIQDQIEIHKANETIIIPLSSTLYHGPLPLDRVAKLHFVPTIFSSQTLLEKNATTQALFDITKSEKPLQLNFAMNYALNGNAELKLASGQYHNEQSKADFDWSNIILNVDLDKNEPSNYTLSVDAFNSNDPNYAVSTTSSIKIKDLVIQGSLQSTKWPFIYSGNINSKIGYFEQNTEFAETGEKFSLIQKNSQTNLTTQVEGDTVNIINKTNLDELHINGNNLGKVTNNVEFNHIDGNALQELLNILVAIGKADSDMPLPKPSVQKLQQAGMEIANNQPQIKFSPLSISDEKGKVALDLNIALVPNPKFDLMRSGLYKQFKDFSINFDVNKETAISLLSKFTPENQKQDLIYRIDELVAEGEANGIIVNTNKTVTLTLALENNELKLNGKPIPEEQLKMILFILVMGGFGR